MSSICLGMAVLIGCVCGFLTKPASAVDNPTAEAMIVYDDGDPVYGTMAEIAASLADENGEPHEKILVKLLSNVTCSMVTSNRGAWMLDLNGYVLDFGMSGYVYCIGDNGVTITDSRPNAAHYYTMGQDGRAQVDDTLDPSQSGVKVLQGGVLTNSLYTIYAGETDVVIAGGNIVGNMVGSAMLNSHLVIESGNITGNVHGLYCLEADVEVNGGTIRGNAVVEEGMSVIEVEGYPEGMKAIVKRGCLFAGGTLTINGGVIEQSLLFSTVAKASVIINGGSVEQVLLMDEENKTLTQPTSDQLTLGENVGPVMDGDKIIGYGHKHVWGEWETVVESTCNVEGSRQRICDACSAVEMGIIDTDPSKHIFGEWETTTQPTCSATGTRQRVCTVCADMETQTLDPIPSNHYYDPALNQVTAPTCTQTGYTTHHCAYCDVEYRDSETPKIAHTFGEWETTTESTCTGEGTIQRTCTVCGFVETKQTESAGHDYQLNTVPATCLMRGYTEHKCSKCEAIYYTDEVPALGHNWSEYTTTSEPTCEAAGEESHECANCHEVETRVLSAIGHDWSAWKTTQSATCTADGEQQRECHNCEQIQTRVVSAEGHDYLEKVTAPTCLEAGFTTHLCTRCGDTYRDQETVALGHNFGDWETVTTATCTRVGLRRQVCTACGFTESETLAMLPHEYEEQTVAATCLNAGYTQHTCQNCGSAYREVVAALGHNYETQTTKEPTCTELGVETTTCTRCDDHYETPLPILNHDYQETVYPATCQQSGYTLHQCSRCEVYYTDNETTLGDHVFGDWEETEQSSCTNSSVRQRTCTICGYKQLEIGELDQHAWQDDVHAATCTTDGYTERTCTACGIVYRDAIVKATGHVWGEWTEITAPTCTSDGLNQRECTVCDAIQTQPVDALGHSYQDDETVPATCVAEGYTLHTCSRCDYQYKDNLVAALGHDYVETIVSATCEDGGYTIHQCSRCDDEYYSDQTVALGHDWDEWKTIKAALCLTEGTCERECAICHKTEQQILPALGHDDVNTVVEPNCVNGGYTDHVCMRCRLSYRDTVTSALGHDWSEWEALEETTTEGKKQVVHTCHRCGLKETKEADEEQSEIIGGPTGGDNGGTKLDTEKWLIAGIVAGLVLIGGGAAMLFVGLVRRRKHLALAA